MWVMSLPVVMFLNVFAFAFSAFTLFLISLLLSHCGFGHFRSTVRFGHRRSFIVSCSPLGCFFSCRSSRACCALLAVDSIGFVFLRCVSRFAWRSARRLTPFSGLRNFAFVSRVSPLRYCDSRKYIDGSSHPTSEFRTARAISRHFLLSCLYGDCQGDWSANVLYVAPCLCVVGGLYPLRILVFSFCIFYIAYSVPRFRLLLAS